MAGYPALRVTTLAETGTRGLPTSALRIEELVRQLKEHYTVIIVTHNIR